MQLLKFLINPQNSCYIYDARNSCPLQYQGSNVVVKWLTLLLRIREIQSSNLGTETGYPDLRFSGFTQSLQ
jgi:hypothetical protein